jgi:hypothetical protein
VNFQGWQARSGEVADGALVATFAVGKAFDGDDCAGVRDVVRGDEGAELFVGGDEFVVYDGDDGFGEALFVFR